MTGHGVSSRSSHSWATGRTTFSAKSWTHFWICSWSSFSSSEKSLIFSPLPGVVTSKLLNSNISRAGSSETSRGNRAEHHDHGASRVGRPDADALEDDSAGEGTDDPGEPTGRLLRAKGAPAPAAGPPSHRRRQRRHGEALADHQREERRHEQPPRVHRRQQRQTGGV